MNTTTISIDDDLPVIRVAVALAAGGFVLINDSRGGLVITTRDRANALRAACTDKTESPSSVDGAGGVHSDDGDPTPWCHGCGAMTKAHCACGPLADNDLREADDRQRADDINAERRLLGF